MDPNGWIILRYFLENGWIDVKSNVVLRWIQPKGWMSNHWQRNTSRFNRYLKQTDRQAPTADLTETRGFDRKMREIINSARKLKFERVLK